MTGPVYEVPGWKYDQVEQAVVESQVAERVAAQRRREEKLFRGSMAFTRYAATIAAVRAINMLGNYYYARGRSLVYIDPHATISLFLCYIGLAWGILTFCFVLQGRQYTGQKRRNHSPFHLIPVAILVFACGITIWTSVSAQS